MPAKQLPNLTLPITPAERALILTLRSQQAADVVTANPVYCELLRCSGRDVAEAIQVISTSHKHMADLLQPLSRANNLLIYLNENTREVAFGGSCSTNHVSRGV